MVMNTNKKGCMIWHRLCFKYEATSQANNVNRNTTNQGKGDLSWTDKRQKKQKTLLFMVSATINAYGAEPV
jgi:hypothetical protein